MKGKKNNLEVIFNPLKNIAVNCLEDFLKQTLTKLTESIPLNPPLTNLTKTVDKVNMNKIEILSEKSLPRFIQIDFDEYALPKEIDSKKTTKSLNDFDDIFAREVL